MSPTAAIDKCRTAYTDTFEAFRDADPSGAIANADELRALCASAYKSAMPPLTTWANIRAHIACINQALLLDVLSEPEAKTLAYLAQTALATWAKKKQTK
jgi:hypothetical protein